MQHSSAAISKTFVISWTRKLLGGVRTLPGDDRVDGVPPVVLDGVQVGVADPAVEHLDGDIVVSSVPAEPSNERQHEQIQS